MFLNLFKHRHIIRTPTDSGRLNHIERNAISQGICTALSDKNSPLKNTAGVLALMYSLGKDFEKVLSLRINQDIYPETGKFRLKLQLGKDQVKPDETEQDAFELCSETIELNLHPFIQSWLATLYSNCQHQPVSMKGLLGSQAVTQNQVTGGRTRGNISGS